MGRRTRMMTPTKKVPVFPVEVKHQQPDHPRQWTVQEALDLLRSGYALPVVADRTGKNRVQLRELAKASRIQIRER